MGNDSYAGDVVSFLHESNPEVLSSTSIKGFLSIQHQDASTGKITDHSTSNCLFRAGINAMFRGLASQGSGGTASIKTGIWLSGTATNATRGSNAQTSTYTSLICGDAVGSGDVLYPNDTNTTVNLSSGTDMNNNKGVWFGPSEADIFTGQSIQASGTDNATFTLQSDTLVVKADVQSGSSAQEVDGIFVADQTVATNPTRAQILLLAGRTSGTGSNASENMTKIVMNNNDTLSITYSLVITSSAT